MNTKKAAPKAKAMSTGAIRPSQKPCSRSTTYIPPITKFPVSFILITNKNMLMFTTTKAAKSDIKNFNGAATIIGNFTFMILTFSPIPLIALTPL